MADKSKKKFKMKSPIVVDMGDDAKYTIIGGSDKQRKRIRANQLEYNLDKQGYAGTPEKESRSKVNPIDNANRIRAGLKKGGSAKKKKSSRKAVRGGGCEIR